MDESIDHAGCTSDTSSSQKDISRIFPMHKSGVPTNSYGGTMNTFVDLLSVATVVLLAYNLGSVSRRVEELETWVKRHKALFKDEEKA